MPCILRHLKNKNHCFGANKEVYYITYVMHYIISLLFFDKKNFISTFPVVDI